MTTNEVVNEKLEKRNAALARRDSLTAALHAAERELDDARESLASAYEAIRGAAPEVLTIRIPLREIDADRSKNVTEGEKALRVAKNHGVPEDARYVGHVVYTNGYPDPWNHWAEVRYVVPVMA